MSSKKNENNPVVHAGDVIAIRGKAPIILDQPKNPQPKTEVENARNCTVRARKD